MMPRVWATNERPVHASGFVGTKPTDRAAEAAARPVPRPALARVVEAGGRRYVAYDADQVVNTDGAYEGFRDDHIRASNSNMMPIDVAKRGRRRSADA